MAGFLGVFRSGEDFAIALVAKTGDPIGLTATAWLHRSKDKINFVPDPTFTPVQLNAVFRPASGTWGAGWNIGVSAAQSAVLKEGCYGIDARIVDSAGAVDLTETTAMIHITKSAVPVT